ncbi:MAG: hypothetical protein B7Y45_08925 [Sphingomonas sp. 28-66-16]|nr:MAG: hypothetical protein B7Y45_08925 [Sphingomonas sp. 28-66-16]
MASGSYFQCNQTSLFFFEAVFIAPDQNTVLKIFAAPPRNCLRRHFQPCQYVVEGIVYCMEVHNLRRQKN